MDSLSQIEFYWYWFGFASLLLLLEAVHGRFVFMAASVAAVAAGVQASLFPYIEIWIQVTLFVVLATGFVWVSHIYLRDRMVRIARQQDIFKNRRYVGQVMTLVNPIVDGYSSLNIDGMIWILQGEDCPTGSQVKVTDMGAGWLKVESL